MSNLGLDRCVPDPKPTNNDSNSMGHGYSEVKSSSDRPAPNRYDKIKVGEGLSSATRFVILIGLAVPIVISYALHKERIRSNEANDSMEILVQ